MDLARVSHSVLQKYPEREWKRFEIESFTLEPARIEVICSALISVESALRVHEIVCQGKSPAQFSFAATVFKLRRLASSRLLVQKRGVRGCSGRVKHGSVGSVIMRGATRVLAQNAGWSRLLGKMPHTSGSGVGRNGSGSEENHRASNQGHGPGESVRRRLAHRK